MRRILLLTASVLLAVGAAMAQGVTTASMTGVVKDSKGEIVPGATIIATHTPSGTTYGVASREDGYYNLLGMRVGGPYTIKVTMIGYKEQVTENIYLQLGQSFVLNVALLDDAAQLEEVVISSKVDPTLNSDKMGTSSNFSVTQIQTLPSIGRDFRDISRLTPQAGGSQFSFGGRAAIYNNLSIDGATANNVFGLSPLPAGQSATTPFSMDAIQEITVSLSPYDVRQGNFTGAGISAITRSGTNEFSGSAYYFFRNESLAGKKVDGVELPVPSFKFQNYGVRLGGPIIKNKLFFFANLEFEKRTDPFYTNPVRKNRDQSIVGATQGTDDNDPETGLAGLRDFLINTVGYDPGTYKNFDRETNSIRYVMRLDYNINQNHKLTIRGNVTNAYQDQPPSGSTGFGPALPGGRGNSNNVLSFSSSYYRINNNNYSVTAELNSTFGGGKYTNTLVAGYTAFRDFRENAGGLAVPNFPLVDILGPNGNTLTTFGPDPFTPNNKLDQDVLQINDNFSVYLKNHTITLGTNNELYSFNNVFTQLYNGVYRYNSLADFYADANATAVPPTTPGAGPSAYTIQYVASKGGPAGTAAKWSALQMGFYVQDEYTAIPNLKIIGGLRVDIPLYLTELDRNNYINQIDFNGEQLRVGGWPQVTPLWSPRIGFNWDVTGDRSTQVRGGTGVLTGRVPFVWLSNTVNANGLYFGEFNSTSVPLDNTGDGFPYNFSTNPYRPNPETLTDPSTGNPIIIADRNNVNFGRPANVTTTNTLSKNFKFPQVWRTNLAVDKQLPYGIVGTLEMIYTKDINAVYIRNANLKEAVGTLAGDGRPLWSPAGGARQIYGNDRRISGDVGQALVLDNTKKGYQWSITAQLQKTFSRNFMVSGAYTYTDAREINPATGTTAGSIYNSQVSVLGANNPGLSYANTLTPHRVIAYASYKLEYLEHFATTFGVTYEGRTGNSFSYVYNGDINSDGVNGDLMYIPKDRNEIALTTSGATDTRTIDQIWTQLDNYIKQDEYLSEHRGQYAARNAAFAPWVNRLNLSVLQDFYVNVKGKRQTFQLSVNVENALNLLNSEWGLIKFASRSSLLRFVGYEQAHTAGSATAPNGSVTTGKPVYAFDVNADGTPLRESFIPDQTVGGRWQMQIGLRYIFN